MHTQPVDPVLLIEAMQLLERHAMLWHYTQHNREYGSWDACELDQCARIREVVEELWQLGCNRLTTSWPE